MGGFFSNIKNKLTTEYYDEEKINKDYVEIDENTKQDIQKTNVRSFILEDFEDVKPILESMRLGKTICLVNIRPLKEKDMIELKRSINKLKKTCEAIEGDIAGFDDDWIVIVPEYVSVYKPSLNDESQNLEEY